MSHTTLLKWACSNVTNTQPLLYRLKILMRCRNVRERVIRNKVRKEIFRSDLLSEIKSLQLHLPYKSYIHGNVFRERNMFLPVRIYDAYALDISML